MYKITLSEQARKEYLYFSQSGNKAILNKIADIIDANTEHLAMVESLDNGKPIRETMAIDIPLSAKI